MEEVEEVVVTVIHCWSAPRSRSTALLYSFEARNNPNVVANNVIDDVEKKKNAVERLRGADQQ